MPKEGDYSWSQIDKSVSSIFDITNVEVPTGELIDFEDHVLKWNKADKKWVLEPDDIGVISGQATSDDILDGEVYDVDINSNAARSSL